jgi:glycosyltransferase involved in cell wall biosynthesis
MLAPIKVLYVIDKMQIGGTERQLAAVIGKLDRERFEPILCCLRESNDGVIGSIPCKKILLGVHSFASPRALFMLCRLTRFLVRERVSIVQTFFIDATIMGMVAAWLAAVRVRISCRRDLGFWYRAGTLLRMKVANKFATRFLTNSQSVKEVLSEKEGVPPERIDVIYNGVEIGEPTPPSDTNCADLKEELFGNTTCPVVGIVSNLNRPVKRVDVFVMAAGLVNEVFPHCRFLVVGSGHLMPKMVDLASKYSLKGKIRFVGTQKDVSRYVGIMDLFVNSSDSEGFSNSVLEAMVAGKPIVATDVGGNREMLKSGGHGLLVPPGDFDAMARAIVRVLQSPGEHIPRGTSAFQKVKEEYSWETIIRQIESYYTGCLDDETR